MLLSYLVLYFSIYNYITFLTEHPRALTRLVPIVSKQLLRVINVWNVTVNIYTTVAVIKDY